MSVQAATCEPLAAVDAATYDLGERVKELNCLYQLNRLLELPGLLPAEILQRAVELLPPAWRFPDLACARLVVEGATYATRDFRETPWRQSATLSVRGRCLGLVEVAYREAPPVPDGPAFLVEEETLLEMVASQLGRFLQLLREEEDLHLYESRFRAIVQYAQDAIVMMDPTGRISFWNPAAETIFGHTADEALGRDLHALLSPVRYHEAMREAFGEFLVSGSGRAVNRTVELFACNKAGHEFPVELSLSAVKLSDGWNAIGLVRDITARQESARALSESEARYRAYFEHGPDGVVVLEPESGKILDFNDRFCRQLGYPREEMFSVSVSEIDAISSPAEDDARIETVRRDGYAEFETVHRRKDGTLIDVYVLARVLDTGGPTVVHCICRDITEQKRAQSELTQSRERYRDILITSMEGFCLVNEDGYLEEVNDAYCQMSGYTADELIGKRVSDVDAVDTDADVAARVARIVEAGRAIFETRHRRKDGSVFDVEVSVQHRPAQHQIVCFVRDITARKRMEKILAARIRLLQISAADSLATVLQRTLDEAELLTESTIGFYHFMDADQVTLSLQAWSTNTSAHMCTAEGAGLHYPVDEAGVWADAIRERRPMIHNDYASLPHRKVLPAGHAPVLRELVVPVMRGDKIVSVLGVGNKPTNYDTHDVDALVSLADFAWDIAERKRAEEERAAIHAQFVQAQKMEAVGHLAGGIAHDFNNLLQVILVNADLVMGELDAGSELWQHLDDVCASAQRATDLTRQLLAFSRRQVMQPVHVDMNDLVHGVVKMLRRVIGEHIELHTVYGEDLAIVHADKGQLEQVLMNLCINARDAMPQGGRIRLETRNQVLDAEFCERHPWAKQGSYVALSVLDTGEGMDAATRARIFEPFFTTKAVGKGTGLGLASVYGIVAQHKGLIDVDSEPGKGSLFTVYIPASSDARFDLGGETRTAARGGSEAILIAEDDPAILALLERMLSSAGYRVFSAADGHQALRLFTENARDIKLVILDVIMPGLGGRAVMNEIQREGHRVPFLFSSGYTQSALDTDSVVEPGLNLITKPYSREVLLHEVRRILDAAAPARP